MLIKSLGNVLLVAAAVLLPLLAFEAAYRVFRLDYTFQAGQELKWLRSTSDFFVVDPDFGFRPRLDTGAYDKFGTAHNQYGIEKTEGVKRLLFIGDSVTARGKIVTALRRQYGDENFEYWNAGVESFNTIQEFHFLEQYNLKINPDHVILSFHLNDYETTPVVFYQGDEMRVYAPDTRLENSHPWLLQNSYIYRLFLNATSNRNEQALAAARQDIFREVHEHLDKMQQLLARRDIQFTVVVLPYFKPYRKWKAEEKERRESTLVALEELGITHFDLLALSEEAHRDGVNTQQRKGDTWHPSEDIADIFASHLYEQDIF